ncbi:hypothetical protein [Zavarzinia compransoris]|uniref:Alpha/beta hydrolase n=1 Tax=Zavarzinia compransoris TaxID=1264899 RepID=A0A317DYA7_9PROT|nr:hypothetical protein [Zavarzinia compransoris]PWR19727.1 hypothetical protein DKG75_14775 [Zavarzinia compransoris]TDP43325.1 hypothetical protein DES42_11226 [Zavarzinia compransoris]
MTDDGTPRAAPVRKRRVLFVSGFDPRGPRHYHQLWRDEAPKAARAFGAATRFDLGNRRRHGETVVEWTISGETPVDGVPVLTETRFDFLRWDDLAREFWPKPDWVFVGRTLRTLVRGIAIGYFRRVYGVRRLYVLTMVQPALLLIALMAGLMLAAGLAAAAGLALAGLALSLAPAGAPLGLLLMPAVLRRLDKGTVLWRGELSSYYGALIFNEAPQMQARMDAMAGLIAAAAAEGGVDELLVIGHSVGTTVAISALARARARRPEAFAGLPAVGFVTLGAMTPALAVEPRAAWFRAEVAALALDPAIAWLDAGAPYDAVCFDRVDPLTLSGHARPPGARISPLLMTPRFHALFDAEAYAALCRDRGQMHTQYLMATPKPGRCDFFALVAGPVALKDRFPEFEQYQG